MRITDLTDTDLNFLLNIFNQISDKVYEKTISGGGVLDLSGEYEDLYQMIKQRIDEDTQKCLDEYIGNSNEYEINELVAEFEMPQFEIKVNKE